MSKMPFIVKSPLPQATVSLFSINELLVLQQNINKHDDFEYYNPLDRKMIFGHVVPDFQRSIVWTETQNIALIESIWRGVNIGQYTINYIPDQNDTLPELHNVILDGQQRLNAIQSYVNDEFAVFGYLFSELNTSNQRKFRNKMFTRTTTQIKSDFEAREFYNVMNFGGTAHTLEEMA